MDNFEKSAKRALDASQGGQARAKKLTSHKKTEIARKAANVRWSKEESSKQSLCKESEFLPAKTLSNNHETLARENIDLERLKKLSENDVQPSHGQSQSLPTAVFWGVLDLMSTQIPCYVLDNGQRIIGRTAANEMLTCIKGGGNFEQTISVKSLKPFLDFNGIINQLVAFRVPEVERLGTDVKGMPADVFIEVCRGFVAALQASYNRPPDADYPPLTDRQKEMAVQASMFLAAVAKVGLDALIDEATGYQEFRAKDALEVKLRAYLADEMRKWEKTFPDQLWMEFGRLTNWKGSIHKRPKYWGKIVMELIYEYLDPDVAQWLRENAPKPRGGQNYHQWLSSQYGLQKLVQHIWQVVGMAKTCQTLPELKERMAETFGNDPVQLTLKLPRQ